MKPVFKPGLYAITAQRYPDMRRLVTEVQHALEGGAAMIQFRDKSKDRAWREDAAGAILEICNGFDAPLLINDDARLVLATGAAGVHLGKNDMSVISARELLGPNKLIGVSCYNSPERASQGVADGADHLAFGSVFASASKPEAVRCELDVIRQARSSGLPVVAIGGITPDNGRAAVEAGADALAVIGAVFDAPDVRKAAASFSEIWES